MEHYYFTEWIVLSSFIRYLFFYPLSVQVETKKTRGVNGGPFFKKTPFWVPCFWCNLMKWKFKTNDFKSRNTLKQWWCLMTIIVFTFLLSRYAYEMKIFKHLYIKTSVLANNDFIKNSHFESVVFTCYCYFKRLSSSGIHLIPLSNNKHNRDNIDSHCEKNTHDYCDYCSCIVVHLLLFSWPLNN